MIDALLEAARLLVLPARRCPARDGCSDDRAVSLDDLASPALALHRCSQATGVFLKFAGRGVEIATTDWRSIRAHAAAYIDGMVVDWTVRQYCDPWYGNARWSTSQPHPWVTTPDEWLAQVSVMT